jgi:hypothetical protein
VSMSERQIAQLAEDLIELGDLDVTPGKSRP